MGPTALLRATLFAALTASLLACSPPGSPAGTACTLPSQCASNLCLSRGTSAVCASRCATSADCTQTGDVCGRFDYRGLDPDSGTFTGPDEDVLHVCRPRLNQVCSASSPCAQIGQTCVGDPGVCTTLCAQDGDCTSLLCVPATSGTCGAPGTCSPLCDDLLECPHGWYCNLVSADMVGHGRCEPIQPITGDPSDVACVDASN